MRNKEIEVKFEFKIPSNKIIEKIISDLKMKRIVKTFQRTHRLDTPTQKLRKQGIFMRTREESKGSDTMTIKIKDLKKKRNKYFEREEYEIEIPNAKEMAEMLKIVGFSRERILEKFRVIFQKKNLIISVDKLPFGNFIEIEGTSDKIEKAIKKLGLDNKYKITDAYWVLYDRYCKKNKIKPGVAIKF